MTTSGRARPLGIEQRRAAIVDAVIPVVLREGAAATSRQLAEAAGVAEGTLFRAFGDKASIIRAAAETYLDPEPLRSAIRRIDRTLPLETKVRTILELLQQRFAGVFQMMRAVGHDGRPPGASARHEYARLVAEALGDDLDRIDWPPERIGPLLRLIAFATSIPQFSSGVSFDLDELTRFALHGIIAPPRDPAS